jgi:hypothetical protein
MGPGTGAEAVDTSRISWSLIFGASPATFTKISVAPKVRPFAIGRKAGLLAGSTVTPVMSTPDEKINPKPVKASGHGNAVIEQNGWLGGARLVMVIRVSPTSIVDKLAGPSTKWAGMIDGSGGGLVGPEGPSISKGAGFVKGAVDEVTTGTAEASR